MSTAPRIHFLGGSPCAGKSTVASLLAARYGLRLYACDDAFERHSAAADPAHAPTLVRLSRMGPDAIFLRARRPMVRDALAACVEAFPLVVADLTSLPPGEPVLAEGMALLPLCVAALGDGAMARAAWLVPEPRFQRTHYSRRVWAHELAARTADPATAFGNWMRRDEASARLIRAQARRVGGSVRIVREGDEVEAVAAWVAARLALTRAGHARVDSGAPAA